MQSLTQSKLLGILFFCKSLLLLALLLSLSFQALGGVTSFSIRVPNKAPGAQISKVQLLVDITSPATAVVPSVGDPAPFSVTDPGTHVLIPTWDSSLYYYGFYPPPADGVSNDDVQINRPTSALASDPLAYRYVITIGINSNTPNFTTPDPLNDHEIWTVSLVTPGTTVISDICVQSLDNRHGTLATPVPDGELMASLETPSIPTNGGIQNCANARPPLDVVLVLDKSGSMSGSTLGGTPEIKINALHSAVTDFVETWDTLRSGESPPPDDKLGIVLFDSNASWWSTIGTGLNTFDSTLSGAIQANVGSIAPGTATALGSGVLLADGVLAPVTPPRRRAVLLMSDGMQNTNQMLGLTTPASGVVSPATYSRSSPGVKTVLPNWEASDQRYPIYGVTVGTSTAVSAQVFEDIKTATHGGYVNTETDEQLLRPFFLQALQNFIRFNTWETLRMVSAKIGWSAPYSTQVPVASTSKKVSITVMSPRKYGWLKLSVLPPGETQPIVETGGGSIQMHINLPTSTNYRPQDGWQISVEVLDPSEEGGGLAKNNKWPIDLTVMADDMGIKSELAAMPKAYVPGDQIVLRASVKEFGRKLTTLGTNPGDRLLVQVVKPGVSIGDLLSSSQASTASPSPSDSSTPADARLQNHLQDSPQSLARTEDTISLMDDGRSEHGDAIAGDGVYSAAYKAALPGHYNFLYGIEGQTRESARFSRQQWVTVFVRSTPDKSQTTAQVSTASSGQAVTIILAPKNKGGDLMGPGWANYLWFTGGTQPVKAVDRMDGTYSASVPFSGATPKIALHFLGGSSTIIGDEVSFENLPVQLGPDTMVVSDVNALGDGDGQGHLEWWQWLLLLLLILLLLILLLSKP